MKFRIIDKKKREKKNLEGIDPLLRNRGQSNIIEIKNWRNWKYSFWVKITKYGGSVIVDSGVIEELAEKIRQLRKKKSQKD